jgi:hypothetical protein
MATGLQSNYIHCNSWPSSDHWPSLANFKSKLSKSNLCYDRRSVGQSVLVSSPRPVASLLKWDALSDERMGVSFTIIAGPRQCNHSRVHDNILLSQIRDSPNLDGQVPVFISPRHWVPFSSPPTTRRATVEIFETRLHTNFFTRRLS